MKKILIGVFVIGVLLFSSNVHASEQFVTVTSPNNTNIALNAGQKIEIRWETNVTINALVDVYISDGNNRGPVMRGDNIGNIIYDPGILPAGSNYKAYVSIVSETPIGGRSANPFTIRPAVVDIITSPSTFIPSLTVTSPNNTNIALNAGQKIEIRWETNVTINALVDVYISDGNNRGPVMRGDNIGNIIYDPGILPAGSNYKAYVSIVSETPIGGSSKKPFTIKAVTEQNITNQDSVYPLTVNQYSDTNSTTFKERSSTVSEERTSEVRQESKSVRNQQSNDVVVYQQSLFSRIKIFFKNFRFW